MTFSNDALEEVSNRIKDIETDMQESGSPMMQNVLKLSSCPSQEHEAEQQLSPSSVVDPEQTVPATPPAAATPAMTCEAQKASWMAEWPRLRLEEIKLSKQHRGETEATLAKKEPTSAWAERNATTVAWQRGAGFSDEEAVAYTCISLGGQMAIAQAIREGSHRYAASQGLLLSTLADRAAAVSASAPPTYRHLSGRYGLAAADPAWLKLLEPHAAKGLSFTTSALTMATDDHLSFDSKGYCVRLSTAKKLFYESQDSDVVCFRSHPNEINADTRSPEETRTARSLVQTSNISFHLPPLAKVTLDQIVQPGDWTAYGKTVPRRLFVMEVTFSF